MSLANTKIHDPVLLQEVLSILDPQQGESYLDLTAGYGGHSSEILALTEADAVLVDRDQNAITELEAKFKGEKGLEIVKGDFLHICKELAEQGSTFDLILVDLGISSPQVDQANRGFSLTKDGPLDMRMDTSQELTAEKVVNEYDQESLAEIIQSYGEEPKANAIAKLIVKSRPLRTTQQLADISRKVWPGHSRSHPATRLFQAIRIEVNDELGQLEEALPLMVDLLSPSGRLGIITFHSLEDRIVKRFFREKAGGRYDSVLNELTKRPVTASEDELAINPRSRSAKLRVAAKIKTKKEGRG